MSPWLTVVGIGEDGIGGLGEEARRTVASARVLFGGKRHLALIAETPGQERVSWPTPFAAAFELLKARRGTPVCVLASGDPMLFGVGAALLREFPANEMRVIPSPSSFSLAAARLGWALQDATMLSVHGRPIELVHPHIHPGARLLILSDGKDTPALLARLLAGRGFSSSRVTVLEHLGGPKERIFGGTAGTWAHGAGAGLNLAAVECVADAGAIRLTTLAGLPDSAFKHDGQLTKRDLRAAVLARLAPSPGELLWDVGAGCGSIGIEWMRAHPACRAIAIEADTARRALIEHNRAALGVPGLRLIAGTAPEALAGLEMPDAVFIGGGLTDDGVIERCWRDLRPGGRLVANAVTVQSEAVLAAWHKKTGGEMTRISVAHAEPLGRFDTWRTALPVGILSAVKP